MENARPNLLVGRPLDVRLSAARTPDNAPEHGRGHAAGRAMLALPNMIPSPHRVTGGPTVPIPAGGQAPHPTERSDQQPPMSRGSTCLRGNSSALAPSSCVPSEVSNLATDAPRQSTIKTYDSRLQRYYVWARDNTVDSAGGPSRPSSGLTLGAIPGGATNERY